MLLMRGIEERAMSLYRQGKVPGSFYDGFGQEAVSAGAAFAMAPEDRLCILHRDLAAHLIRGVTPVRILAQYTGRAAGITRGRDGNVHFGDRHLGCVGMVSMLPDMMLVATGMAIAFKLRGERRCALTWFGDGSTSRGDFHEAMNWAGVQRLPVVFVLENNQYAYSTRWTSSRPRCATAPRSSKQRSVGSAACQPAPSVFSSPSRRLPHPKASWPTPLSSLARQPAFNACSWAISARRATSSPTPSSGMPIPRRPFRS
jgi:TPP-dependent pyruvate/acetoin dehydrogenase alpha subunit